MGLELGGMSLWISIQRNHRRRLCLNAVKHIDNLSPILRSCLLEYGVADAVMKKSFESGLSFGTTSGIVTTLGLIVGLGSGTHSTLAVVGGILSLAIADGLSESMSMHVSKKIESKDPIYLWESTFSTLISKFIVTMSFAIPVLVTNLQAAILIDIAWGLSLLIVLSYFVSEYEGRRKWRDIFEHLMIAVLVIALTYYAGEWINARFLT
jgi:VIT1/CCC1 family predicted Fe2+/Mn2+ transporter